MDLKELLDQVHDEASFLAFVRGLLQDWRTDGASWENGTVEDFLESALAWGESTRVGSSQGIGSASPWKRAATLLYCGKIYE